MKLLGAAERLMLEKGFNATSVEDICSASGLTKGSFFHYFESKEQLGKAVLEYFSERREKEFEKAEYRKLSDPLDRVFGAIENYATVSRRTFEDPEAFAGCLIGNLAQELSNVYPTIRSQCVDCFTQVAKELEGDLKLAKVQYAPKSHIDPEALAEHFVMIMQGAMVIAKTQQNPKPILAGLQNYEKYLRFLFNK
jgi:TetR/AcrR family transcriptional repressor of nem operon